MQYANSYRFNGTVTGDVESKKSAGLGMEKIDDFDLGIHHAFYRTYDPVIGRMMQIDPLAEQAGMISLTPYNAFVNNPILFADPNGDKIRISRDFESRSARKEFKRDYKEAIGHLNDNNASQILTGLKKAKTKITIADAKGGAKGFDPSTNTISWDPNQGLQTDNGTVLSATSVLSHEADHALKSIEDPQGQYDDQNTADADYGDLEEKRVITGSEQTTAQKLGEVKKGKITRKNHRGTFVPTKGPKSTKIDTDALIDEIMDHEIEGPDDGWK